MLAAGFNRRLRTLLTLTLLVIVGLVAVGCETNAPSQGPDTAGAPPAQESQTAADSALSQDKTGPGYIHNLPIGTEADIGYQVGEYIPEFSLGLVDGQTVTATSQVTGGRPTFLFFWATT